jgi:hypothetical protein
MTMLTRLLGRTGRIVPALAAAGVLTAVTTFTAMTGGSAAGAAVAASVPRCNAAKAHQEMAHKLARAIGAAMRARFTSADRSYNPFDDVSVSVSDDSLGLSCWYGTARKNYSASAVKATIFAALLLKAQDEHRSLDTWEKNEAWLMITQSDNAAASALWAHVGLTGLQHFLNRAKMKQTVLNTWGAWGLTEITAHDETLLLRLLMSPGQVLRTASRQYELNLMNHVISSETWGVRAGSPKYFSWHIKNGWSPLPDPTSSPWVVNSIGCFIHKTFGYTIVVLTQDNPAPGLSYGIGTIEKIAWVINRALVPGARSVWPKLTATQVSERPLVPDQVPAGPPGGR